MEAQHPFSLTEKAATHIRKTMAKEGAEGQGLRVSVVTGGCSGFEYSLAFAPEPEPGDQTFEDQSVRIFLDELSIEKLSGTVLDYVDGLYGGGLKFSNPKAAHTCGCGTSFSLE